MKPFWIALLCVTTTAICAETLTVNVYRTADKGQGVDIGTLTFVDKYHGLLIQPKLHGLTPGLHGFHVHSKPNCSNNGLAAGGHFDPAHTGKHLGPYNSSGHLGDMPPLFVDKKGQSILPIFAPRLHVRNLRGHSIIIHEGGDNFSDSPEKLGGGGKRIACAVIPKYNKSQKITRSKK